MEPAGAGLVRGEETIFAVATGPLGGGIAIIRISGAQAREALRALTGRAAWTPRRLGRVQVRAADGEPLDEGLAVFFPSPGSATGEDVAELHVHGGRAVVGGILDALGSVPGLRGAEAGEFARRAFVAGKLDLTQVEAIADLVAADTAAQRRQALRQLSGALGDVYEGWRMRLLRAGVFLEGSIDFSDDDLPDGLVSSAIEAIGVVREEIERHLADGGRGERLREGTVVVVLGAPNAGKSSLVNALAGDEVAIVHAEPGTTRDLIRVPLSLGGSPVTIIDTAGLREATHAVEREGIRRSQRAAEQADVRVVVIDGDHWPVVDPAVQSFVGERAIVVLSKRDLPGVPPVAEINGVSVIGVSALSGEGVAALKERIEAAVGGEGLGGVCLTRVRHRRELERCSAALQEARAVAAIELAAEHLREAVAALRRITGQGNVDEVLNGIFAEFCIGK